MIARYIEITKPGIIFGNLISVIGGFLLASQGDINYIELCSTVFGAGLIVASSCVYNNYIDRDIDKKTHRTKNRALAKGLISLKLSLMYATILGVTGFAVLYSKANFLAMSVAAIGMIIYVCIYSLYMKRHSLHGTFVGSLSGATPPIIGYCAASNQLQPGALILLIIFSLWQIPHSYAIAIYRIQDYQLANIPILPVVKGVFITKRYITIYIIAFIAATLMLKIFGYTGYKYLVVVSIVNTWWLMIAISGYTTQDDRLWARKLFLISIVVITTLSIMMSVDVIAVNPKHVPVYIS
ncbi:Protoheme IX farnesyltransferase [Candidatus Erwinia haradaeae]|uniref:Protoheme IX farnesyltransferase n=1 Tax=Candidatus Erwinia haradaeae TaxID=1922217 RepID=A0A451DL60_9GAMM|nr:heme o synthase [Candidatus Erwinia haradaeae]VFP87462.1 Protoheme IX farnesyltransferase [Candidatus Erwinia haradaeae]